MDETSAALIRSTIHDLANVLAGVRGILELNSPGQPLSQRDRDRLTAVLEEGVTTLDRSRHLALSAFPEERLEPGALWRAQLLAVLQPMGTLFRCRFELGFAGEPQWDRWPGDLLRGYAAAVTRQVLPLARTDTLRIHCSADPAHWRLGWEQAGEVPSSLDPARPSGDVCSRWAQEAGARLGAVISCAGGSLLISIPRATPVPPG